MEGLRVDGAKERQPGGIPRVVPEIPGVGTAGEPCELRA